MSLDFGASWCPNQNWLLAADLIGLTDGIEISFGAEYTFLGTNRSESGSIVVTVGAADALAVVGDFNGDGIDEIGLYIKIDKRSGVFPERYRENVMAVNLATGQVRAFPGDAKVKQVNAEVNILE